MKNGFLAPICFLVFLISVHCNKTLLYKIGENITLILPVKDNIVEVLWAKYGEIFLDLSFDNNGDFVNKASNPRNCLFNYTSITIYNATSDDEGMYAANVNSSNKTTTEVYYVQRLDDDKSWTNLIIVAVAVAVILVIAITLLIIYRTKSKRNRENRPKFEEVPRQDNPAPDLEQVPLEEIPAPDLEQVPLEEIPAPVRTPPSNISHQNEGGGNEEGGNEERMNEKENEGGQNEEEL